MHYSGSASPIGLKCFHNLNLSLNRNANGLTQIILFQTLNRKARITATIVARYRFSPQPILLTMVQIQAARAPIIKIKGLYLILLLYLNRLPSVLRTI